MIARLSSYRGRPRPDKSNLIDGPTYTQEDGEVPPYGGHAFHERARLSRNRRGPTRTLRKIPQSEALCDRHVEGFVMRDLIGDRSQRIEDEMGQAGAKGRIMRLRGDSVILSVL